MFFVGHHSGTCVVYTGETVNFRKGEWAALWFFLPVITTLILGFGSAEYLGNPEAQKAAEEIAPIEG